MVPENLTNRISFKDIKFEQSLTALTSKPHLGKHAVFQKCDRNYSMNRDHCFSFTTKSFEALIVAKIRKNIK